MTTHPLCNQWSERSAGVLGGGPATLSKYANRYSIPLAPSVLVKGEGAYVTCPDQDTYVDTVAALGPIILGHSNPAVNLAVMQQMEALASSTLSTPLEALVAEQLVAMIPGAEQVRFGCNGKDVTEAAIRLARYVTGRNHVIYVGYHGGFADYLATTDKDGGVLPPLATMNHQVPWRDFDALETLLASLSPRPVGDNIAAIMLEVPPEAPGVPLEDTRAVINRYKNTAHRLGGLFILDEIVTGLRYGLGGAQVYYGVSAELVTMSKALGNGVPIAALMGQRDLMQHFTEGKVFFSTTFGANPLGLAAAKATMEDLRSSTHGWGRLQDYGTTLYQNLAAVCEVYTLPVTLKGNFARMVLQWHPVPGVATAAELHTLWLQETVKQGVLFGVPIFPMCAYDDMVIETICEAMLSAGGVIRAALDEGEVTKALMVPVIGSTFERYPTTQEDVCPVT